jgi:TATA-box binding protein (TBP) (component of TFIID and TFIIIB)
MKEPTKTEIRKVQNIIFSNYDFKRFPSNLKISTMTITGTYGTPINLEFFAKYAELNYSAIWTIKHAALKDGMRTIEENIKKPEKLFMNQATLRIKSDFEKPVNIKIFKNGSIQMTGCKSIYDSTKTLIKLTHELSKIKGIYNKKIKKIEEMKFVDGDIKLTIANIDSLKIQLINSNFTLNDFRIDRKALYEILLLKGVTCTYEPSVHACVNIKYKFGDSVVSTFVFESANIIVTGAKNNRQVLECAQKTLYELIINYNEIVMININDIIEELGYEADDDY